MNKLSLTLTTCLAAIGVLGIAALPAAAADPEKDCAGITNNWTGINKFHIATNPATAGGAAELAAGATLCGSDFTNGATKGFVAGKITMPKGVEVRCANPANANACTAQPDLADGTYIGDVTIDAETVVNGSAFMLDNTHTKMYVNQAPPSVFGQNPNAHCTATATACYQALDDLGTATGDTVVTKNASTGRYELTIHTPVAFIPGMSVYLLKIGGSQAGDPQDLRLCRYAGTVGGTSCGSDPANWLQKNGPKGTYGCSYFPPYMYVAKKVGDLWVVTKVQPKLGYFATATTTATLPSKPKYWWAFKQPNCSGITWS